MPKIRSSDLGNNDLGATLSFIYLRGRELLEAELHRRRNGHIQIDLFEVGRSSCVGSQYLSLSHFSQRQP